jgi:hypothetical protein
MKGHRRASAVVLGWRPPAVHFTMRTFHPVTVDDVCAAVRALPDKQCVSDPLPRQTLKESVDFLAPFIVELFNG